MLVPERGGGGGLRVEVDVDGRVAVEDGTDRDNVRLAARADGGDATDGGCGDVFLDGVG
jgi:hypothetical protein